MICRVQIKTTLMRRIDTDNPGIIKGHTSVFVLVHYADGITQLSHCFGGPTTHASRRAIGPTIKRDVPISCIVHCQMKLKIPTPLTDRRVFR